MSDGRGGRDEIWTVRPLSRRRAAQCGAPPFQGATSGISTVEADEARARPWESPEQQLGGAVWRGWWRRGWEIWVFVVRG